MTIYSKFLHHYQHACREHPKFLHDEKFLQTMSMVRDFHGRGDGTGTPSLLPLDVLKLASSYVIQNIKEASEEIARYNKEVRDKTLLVPMVKRYVRLCRTTMDSIDRLRIGVGICIEKLRSQPVTEAFRCAEDVANASFLSLNYLIGQHVTVLTELQQARDEEMPIRAARPETETSRKLGTTILVTVFATAVICSILAAAFHFPPALAALPGAVISITSWGPFIKWLDGLWAEVVESSSRRSVRRVAGRRRTPTASMREPEILQGTLLKDMTELDEQLEKCRSEIREAQLNLCKEIARPVRRRDRARLFVSRQADKLKEKTERLLERLPESLRNSLSM